MFRFVPKEDYGLVPWENGRGITSDILLLPEGATRQDFDIRISVAPITADAAFSLFPGIDRHITLFKGAGLRLDFLAKSLLLSPLHPASFDNSEPPFARLVDGPIDVFNVMTRQGRWSARVDVLQQDATMLIGRNEIGVIFVAEGEWIAEGGGRTHALQNGGTGIVAQPGVMTLSASPPAAAIFARLTLV